LYVLKSRKNVANPDEHSYVFNGTVISVEQALVGSRRSRHSRNIFANLAIFRVFLRLMERRRDS
jgi:hypothetical protein